MITFLYDMLLEHLSAKKYLKICLESQLSKLESINTVANNLILLDKLPGLYFLKKGYTETLLMQYTPTFKMWFVTFYWLKVSESVISLRNNAYISKN